MRSLVSVGGLREAAAAVVVGWVFAAVGVFVELFVGLGGAEVLAADAVEEEVDDRRGEEREHLRDEQAADDGDAEGARSSEPVPVPKASGTAPSSAAMVVIMMGRKRSRQAW